MLEKIQRRATKLIPGLRDLRWYGMVFIYSTSLYIIYIAHHYNITQDAEREIHDVQYLYVAFP